MPSTAGVSDPLFSLPTSPSLTTTSEPYDAAPMTSNTGFQIDAYYEPSTRQDDEVQNTSPIDPQEKPRACCLPILHEREQDLTVSLEPIDDPLSLPTLDFKPLILRRWVLSMILCFYLGLIGGLGLLYYYENNSGIFHIRATASRFTIRYLPSLIGTLSTIAFHSITTNFARMLPYILMARSTESRTQSATGRQSMLAQYFPLTNMINAFQNRHYPVALMMFLDNYLNPFVTPAKSALLHRTSSIEDPDAWTITISSGAAKYLMFNYTVLFLAILGLQMYLWNRRTGLKWDPVSIADHLVLLQGSNALDDFSGLEYWRPTRRFFADYTQRYMHLERNRYRLGYWRHKATGEYWHGIRRCSTFNEGEGRVRGRTGTHDEPDLLDQSNEAKAWWRSKCNTMLQKPGECYSGLYFYISDYMATITYIVVGSLVGLGIYMIWTEHVNKGVILSGWHFSIVVLVFNFVPAFIIGLLSGYWNQIDAWYRQLQPYMGLRKPSAATENLLLGYPCDLPVVVTLRALSNGHWRVALTSIMPLVNKLSIVLAGSMFAVNRSSSTTDFVVTFAPLSFKSVLGILCGYLILMPIAWPGLDRRLPILPLNIASSITMFYDSTLVRNTIFLPARVDEGRWQMKYRLCLAQRLYGFGIYTGRYGAIHVGIDDVYGHSSDQMGFRIVAPLKPPMRRYRKLLKQAWVWSSGRIGIKRRPTFHEEELQALERLKTTLVGDTSAEDLVDAESLNERLSPHRMPRTDIVQRRNAGSAQRQRHVQERQQYSPAPVQPMTDAVDEDEG